MSQNVSERVHELTRAARMLAIIGAALKLRSAENVDSAMDEQIQEGLRLALGDAATDLDDTEIASVLVQIDMAFAESGELYKNPERTAGWKVEDHQLLQAMGRASRNVVDRILGLAKTRPALRQALNGVFLDVGTGVAGIALRAAETCPDLSVDAIDIWKPALRIAAENVAASPHADRIQLRHLDVTRLEPDPRYTLAWLPAMFLKRAVLEQAIKRIAAASHSGGWLVAAIYTRPEEPFLAVMSSLRTLRSGGDVTSSAELAELLRSCGYVDIELDVAPVATLVLARLP